MENALLRPAAADSKLRYVIASAEKLRDELLPLLRTLV
jgi:hypothetical protein